MADIPLVDRLRAFSKKSDKKLTVKELRTLYDHITNEALEYFFDTIEEDEYFGSLLDDLRTNRL